MKPRFQFETKMKQAQVNWNHGFNKKVNHLFHLNLNELRKPFCTFMEKGKTSETSSRKWNLGLKLKPMQPMKQVLVYESMVSIWKLLELVKPYETRENLWNYWNLGRTVEQGGTSERRGVSI